jgi:hypothetical protein
MPSPILPDGTLLSLPIPSQNELTKYSDLHYESKSYLEIIRQLKPTTKIKEHYTCHLDPDLVEEVLHRTEPWFPLFGQSNQSQTHLVQKGIGVGDMFLFWGWFRQTEEVQDVLRYLPDNPDLHVIWGYMKIKHVSIGKQMPSEYAYHPHGQLEQERNAIYEGDPACIGTLKFDQRLVLTKAGMTRSKWALPDFFRKIPISYHSANSFKDDYFQSALRGQEFVIDECRQVEEWCNSMIHG